MAGRNDLPYVLHISILHIFIYIYYSRIFSCVVENKSSSERNDMCHRSTFIALPLPIRRGFCCCCWCLICDCTCCLSGTMWALFSNEYWRKSIRLRRLCCVLSISVDCRRRLRFVLCDDQYRSVESTVEWMRERPFNQWCRYECLDCYIESR